MSRPARTELMIHRSEVLPIADSAPQTDEATVLVGACRSPSYAAVDWAAHDDIGRADGGNAGTGTSAVNPVVRLTSARPSPPTPRLGSPSPRSQLHIGARHARRLAMSTRRA